MAPPSGGATFLFDIGRSFREYSQRYNFCMQNVLLLSSGSKVTLAQIVARSCKKRGITLHATDKDENVPTSHFVDSFQAIKQEHWPSRLLKYCLDHNVGLIIPSRHADLQELAQESENFSNQGIQIGISSLDTIDLCIDKYSTYQFLQKNGLPSPDTFLLGHDSIKSLKNDCSLFIKPAKGSGSSGVRLVNSVSEITTAELSGDHIAQAVAKGIEYTINVYVSNKGECICAIPHRRVIVDGGESVQAITERIPTLVKLAQSISTALPGAWGPLNIQAFYEPKSDTAKVIEINPRVGGGFSLADQAKGTFMEWLIQEALENRQLKPFSNWTNGLRMMRYRDAIFDFPLPEC